MTTDRDSPGQGGRGPLRREEIEHHLRLVGRYLHERGLIGEILLTGGAYMTLVLRQRWRTCVTSIKHREYEPQTAAETLDLIVGGVGPWLAIGQFLDDWRATDRVKRTRLVGEPLRQVAGDHLRWAALLAAAVDYLCAQDALPAPAWTSRPEYRLPEPWFLYPGWRLRAWQLIETPVPFRMRNIFGGDRILTRV